MQIFSLMADQESIAYTEPLYMTNQLRQSRLVDDPRSTYVEEQDESDDDDDDFDEVSQGTNCPGWYGCLTRCDRL